MNETRISERAPCRYIVLTGPRNAVYGSIDTRREPQALAALQGQYRMGLQSRDAHPEVGREEWYIFGLRA